MFIGMPVCFFVLYFLVGILIGFGVSSSVLSVFLTDGLFAVVYGFLYYRMYYRKCSQDFSKYRFSGFGFLVMFAAFMCVFLFSQLMGTWIHQTFPSDTIHAYFDLEGTQLQLYVLSAVTVAPIAEELLFRGFLYQFMRRWYGKLFCTVFSFVLFAFIHGTTEHIPVALMVTLFSCVLIEVTGNLLYSIAFHMLYNLCGAVYVTQVPLTGIAILVGFGVTFLCLCLGIRFSDVLKDKLAPGGMTSIVDFLDEKRGHMSYVDEDKDDEEKDGGA